MPAPPPSIGSFRGVSRNPNSCGAVRSSSHEYRLQSSVFRSAVCSFASHSRSRFAIASAQSSQNAAYGSGTGGGVAFSPRSSTASAQAVNCSRPLRSQDSAVGNGIRAIPAAMRIVPPLASASMNFSRVSADSFGFDPPSPLARRVAERRARPSAGIGCPFRI